MPLSSVVPVRRTLTDQHHGVRDLALLRFEHGAEGRDGAVLTLGVTIQNCFSSFPKDHDDAHNNTTSQSRPVGGESWKREKPKRNRGRNIQSCEPREKISDPINGS